MECVDEEGWCCGVLLLLEREKGEEAKAAYGVLVLYISEGTVLGLESCCCGKGENTEQESEDKRTVDTKRHGAKDLPCRQKIGK